MTDEPKAKNSQKRSGKKKPILFATVATAGVLGGSGLYSVSLLQPVGKGKTRTLVIPKGAGTVTVAHLLERDGLIRSAFAFRVFAKVEGQGEHFKPGRYNLSDTLTLDELAKRLNAGPRADEQLVRVTIPEGYTVKQIAETLERKGVCTAQDFLYLTTDSQGIAQLHAEFPLPKETLEGFLFPDTYDFDRKTTAKQAAEAMLMNFTGRFVRPYQQEISETHSISEKSSEKEREQANNHSLQEIVTIASLIEREAKVEEDRPRIAGVIENRLAKGMKLQIDATVLYALGHHKNRVLFADLRVDSPYNTYRVKGLPPGAIANPGLPSLLAALRPEKNDFLYYVARPNGAHIFTRTVGEHERAKEQARRERRSAKVDSQASAGGQRT